jgi:clan AA aspartic protease (TIGR02281 family)
MPRRFPSVLAVLVALVLGSSAAAPYRRADDRGARPGQPAPVAPTSAPVASLRAAPPVLPTSLHHVPLSGDRSHLIVHGTFNDLLSGLLLVDTGASYCVLTRETARRLGVVPTANRAIPVATANGNVAADLVQLESVQIADARIARVDAVILDAVDPPLIGILGLSFLNQFRYSVDHARGTIQLER